MFAGQIAYLEKLLPSTTGAQISWAYSGEEWGFIESCAPKHSQAARIAREAITYLAARAPLPLSRPSAPGNDAAVDPANTSGAVASDRKRGKGRTNGKRGKAVVHSARKRRP